MVGYTQPFGTLLSPEVRRALLLLLLLLVCCVQASAARCTAAAPLPCCLPIVSSPRADVLRAGQGAPVYYQTRRPTEPHAGSTICLDKTYLLDTGGRQLPGVGCMVWVRLACSTQPGLDNTYLLDTGGRQPQLASRCKVLQGWHGHAAHTAVAAPALSAAVLRLDPDGLRGLQYALDNLHYAQFAAGGAEGFWRLLAKDNPLCAGASCQTGVHRWLAGQRMHAPIGVGTHQAF